MKVQLIFYLSVILLLSLNSRGSDGVGLNPVLTMLGCSAEKWNANQCKDKRIPLNLKASDHQPYRSVGFLDCKSNPGKVYTGSFVFVTTPHLEKSNAPQKFVALSAAHNFYVPQKIRKGLRPKDCWAQLPLKDNTWLNLSIDNFFINPKYNPVLDPTDMSFISMDAENDWAIFSFSLSKNQPQNQHQLSRIKPSVLTIPDPAFFKNKKLTLVAADPTHSRVSLSSNCESRSGVHASSSNLIKNHNLIMHFCDSMGGSSGGGLFWNSQLIALHTGARWGPPGQENKQGFFRYHFDTMINVGHFITEDMITTAERLALEGTTSPSGK